MSIIDNVFFPLKEIEKIRSPKESEDLILNYIEEYRDLLDFRNHVHKPTDHRQNLYRFTVKVLSLDLLTKLSKDKRVKNVFYAASAAPPGGSIDSISLRFKVFVEYY
tara:strand:- start:7 stop:327 length:321 start_codon:yes stop_codon:yes gene_type:complete